MGPFKAHLERGLVFLEDAGGQDGGGQDQASRPRIWKPSEELLQPLFYLKQISFP